MKFNFDENIDRLRSNSVKYDLREVYFGSKEVIPLWVADMDFATPECIREAVQKRAQHEIYGYSLKPDGFFNSIQKWISKQHNWDIEKESIAFSPGVVPGLVLSILANSNPGDKIIIQTPVYFPFFQSIEGNDRKIIINPLICNIIDEFSRHNISNTLFNLPFSRTPYFTIKAKSGA